ncbi:hypothetical protein BZG36_02600 [Bifiguratus adelaidae]|uniref:Cleavage stimulation factor 50 kDa subunit n=1 Tax=Bifiguratus adelaidae TaxID=1938954 RepID=A0A261Y2S8_9FUNG|nr:hypothetical protein BZG36_02600 [Bifiguratus adelaidae]
MEQSALSQADMLPLIVSQLAAYGFSQLAQTVAEVTGCDGNVKPSYRLAELTSLGQDYGKYEAQDEPDFGTRPRDAQDKDEGQDSDTADQTQANKAQKDRKATTEAIGLIVDPSTNYITKEAPDYSLSFYTLHKAACRTAVFSPDGRFAASGSKDTTLKLLDVSKLKERAQDKPARPVLRALYDHTESVNDIAFHPNGLVLASCSDDLSIKLFDLSKSGAKRAFRYLQDTQMINSIAFHPSGDYILAGTNDSVVRIFDVKTFQCYAPPGDAKHTSGITQVRYSPSGSMFMSSSLDGSVKIWDGVNGKCIRTIAQAHGGSEVNCSMMSQNERYVLSAGKDSTVRLWDVTSGKQVMEYRGATCVREELKATFNYNEDFVMMGDESTHTVYVWDTRTGQLSTRIGGHDDIVRCVASSPIDDGLLTCRQFGPPVSRFLSASVANAGIAHASSSSTLSQASGFASNGKHFPMRQRRNSESALPSIHQYSMLQGDEDNGTLAHSTLLPASPSSMRYLPYPTNLYTPTIASKPDPEPGYPSNTIEIPTLPSNALAFSTAKDVMYKKSLRLLQLWPLPIITRIFVALTLFISVLNAVGILQLTCAAPSHVFHHGEVVNFMWSPFLIQWSSFSSICLMTLNVLILGLFEESLTHVFYGTHQAFTICVMGVAMLTYSFRIGMGHLFSKGTGFAVPWLFFSESVHECNQGISPFLFALLIIQSCNLDDRYILYYGTERHSHIKIPKVVLLSLLLLFNFLDKNRFWWSLSGTLAGGISVLLVCAGKFAQYLLRQSYASSAAHSRSENMMRGGNDEDGFSVFKGHRSLQYTALTWFRNGLAFIVGLVGILIIINNSYPSPSHATPEQVAAQTSEHIMFQFVVMTAPRKGDPDYLMRTLDSYLNQWPESPASDSLYARTKLNVYTHFSEHPRFAEARDYYQRDTKGQHYVRWVQEAGIEYNHRLHLAKALLRFATEEQPVTYVGLLEDDFPLCPDKAWTDLLTVVQRAHEQLPGHCGIFFGTGGNGLLIRPHIAHVAARLLMSSSPLLLAMPPDIVIQKCLMGELAGCEMCSGLSETSHSQSGKLKHQDIGGLVTSRTLLSYHIGYNTSTSDERVYLERDFQCGWRQPLNGNPDVLTL